MSKVKVHTYFLKEAWIEGFGVAKAPMLDHGIGLTLVVVPQVEVRCIIIVHIHVLG